MKKQLVKRLQNWLSNQQESMTGEELCEINIKLYSTIRTGTLSFKVEIPLKELIGEINNTEKINELADEILS